MAIGLPPITKYKYDNAHISTVLPDLLRILGVILCCFVTDLTKGFDH